MRDGRQRPPVWLLIMGALSSAASAEPVRIPVQDFKVLLVQAIDAPDGKAHGILVGELATALSARMQTAAPILLDVSTLKRYRQEGCRRLNLRIRQDAVVLPGTTQPQSKFLDVGINYCRDGSPPRSLS